MFEVFFDRSGRIFERSGFDLGTQKSTESFLFDPDDDDFFALRCDRAWSAFPRFSHISAFDITDFADGFMTRIDEMHGQCRSIDKDIRGTRAIFFEWNDYVSACHIFCMQP